MGYLPKTVGLDGLLEAIRAVAWGESVLPPAVAAVVVRHLAGKEPAEEAVLISLEHLKRASRAVPIPARPEPKH